MAPTLRTTDRSRIQRLGASALSWWERHQQPSSRPADIAADQSACLHRLITHLRATRQGRRWGLDRLASGSAADLVRRFQAQIPLGDYQGISDLVSDIRAGMPDMLAPGRPLALAQTSGTTSAQASGERYVPQYRRLLAHHRQGGALALARMLADAPDALAGRALMLGGCAALDERHHPPSGDLSGIIAATLPRWISWWSEPGLAIARIPEWDQRLAAIVERCGDRDIRLLSGIPSWLLLLLRRLAERGGRHTCWPHLRGVIHGGHAIEPCIPALLEHLDPDTRMLEVYPASEAFIAVGQRSWRLGDGTPEPLQLLTHHDLFLEFITDDGRSVGAHQLEAGGLYQVAVTTPGGLLRYRIGDLVRACGPGSVRFAGRVRTRLNAFGEHVEGDALAAALAQACTDSQAIVDHYHVVPVVPQRDDARGSHCWWIEFRRAPTDLGLFATQLDTALQSAVLDYAAHRQGGQMAMPCIRPVPTGSFVRCLAAQGPLNGQRKIPQAWPDDTFARRLSEQVFTVSGASSTSFPGTTP